MGKFNRKATLTHTIGDGCKFMLIANLVYTSREGSHYEAPEGFKTDGASIPRFAWSIIGGPLSGNYIEAALIHDAVYKFGARIPYDYATISTRKEADQIFYDIMRECGVSWLKAQAMHKAVKMGGWVPWNKYRKADK